MISPNPCPFCAGTKIDYSISVRSTGGKVQYRGSMYCKSCYAYGPRVRSETVNYNDYQERRNIREDDKIKQLARRAWNKRS